MGVEPIEDAKPLDLMIETGHPMRQRFHGITGLDVDDLDSQRSCGLNFFKRQAAERVDRFARIAIALGGFLSGRENEALDVAAKPQRVNFELPLVAARRRGGGRKAVDGQIFGGRLVHILHPA